MHTAAGCSDGLSKTATNLETGKRAMLKERQDTPLSVHPFFRRLWCPVSRLLSDVSAERTQRWKLRSTEPFVLRKTARLLPIKGIHRRPRLLSTTARMYFLTTPPPSTSFFEFSPVTRRLLSPVSWKQSSRSRRKGKPGCGKSLEKTTHGLSKRTRSNLMRKPGK